jgi:prepilin-type N-terminal cleavage/methylation domain-containing protein
MKRQRQDGVTLIEMLIVVTIIGIIASVSFPALTAGLASVRFRPHRARRLVF